MDLRVKYFVHEKRCYLKMKRKDVTTNNYIFLISCHVGRLGGQLQRLYSDLESGLNDATVS